MPATRQCAECGTPLPEGVPASSCPSCALRGALALLVERSEPATQEKPGDQIGPYKLLEKIGEGGWGTVYRAEQAEPICRRVALKVVKLGLDTEQVIARFKTERQALALMDHPSIAHVLDAGATDTGRPFFVMELVEGIKITEFCDQHKLSTRERLALFAKVCQAIQHAHQKGVIHRDIKPSNVLVTVQDGVPVPKVIDFGIAKATQEPLLPRTVATARDAFLGTPAYMSPEQAALRHNDVDTRSDIYALGVLLYELLTGHLPFEQQELLQAGFDEMRRVIREQEPAKPSTRLNRLDTATQASIALHQQTHAPKLIRTVQGDLDWIVMKCLEKERARRYESASGLADDIQRHLDNEPVVAGPPSARYRFQKLVRRNKGTFASLAVISLVLAAATVISALQAKTARIEARKSQQVALFLQDMLKGVGPSVALGRDTTMLKEILDQTAERISKELQDAPDVQAQLQATIGNVYEDLGEAGKAEAMHRSVLALSTSLWGAGHSNTASALNNLALALKAQGRLTEAESIDRQALAMRRKLFGDNHPDVAVSLENLAQDLGLQGKLDEAEARLREVIALQRKLLGNEHAALATTIQNLGQTIRVNGRLPEAEKLELEALEMRRKLFGNEHPTVAVSLNGLGIVLDEQRRWDEAERAYLEALRLRRKFFGNDHPQVSETINNLANLYHDQEKLNEAESMHREALRINRKTRGDEHPEVANSLNNLSLILRDEEKLAEAEAMQRDALAMWKKFYGENHFQVANSLNSLASIVSDQGKIEMAVNIQRDAVAMQRKLLGDNHPAVALFLYNLGRILSSQGKHAEAESVHREALNLRRKNLGNENLDVALSLEGLAGEFRETGKLQEMEDCLKECLAIREKTLPDHWLTFRARSALGGCFLEQKRYSEAEPLLLSSYAALDHQRQFIIKRNHCLQDALERLVRFGEATGRLESTAEWKQKLEALTNAAPSATTPQQLNQK